MTRFRQLISSLRSVLNAIEDLIVMNLDEIAANLRRFNRRETTKMDRQHLIAKITELGYEPETCPRCKEETLWPLPNHALNARSRADNSVICSACGVDEAMSGMKR